MTETDKLTMNYSGAVYRVGYRNNVGTQRASKSDGQSFKEDAVSVYVKDQVGGILEKASST